MASTGSYGAYSFADYQIALAGPGGTINLSELGIADEGITVAMRDPKNTMVTGADGSVMHSLRVSRAGTITVRVQKTGVLNALLMDVYNFQTTSSAFHGRNTISASNPVAGDSMTAVACAFQKLPDQVNATEANINEWVFDCGAISQKLGTGLAFGEAVA